MPELALALASYTTSGDTTVLFESAIASASLSKR